MKRYDIKELIRLWASEGITADQAIGQLIQHIEALEARLTAIESNRSVVSPVGLQPPLNTAKHSQRQLAGVASASA